MEIRCRYKRFDRVYIDCDGTLHRCCYIPAEIYKPNKHITASDTKLLTAQYAVTDTYNLLNKPSGTILDLKENDFFNDLEEMWKDGGPTVCSKNCGYNVSGSSRTKYEDMV